MRFKKTGNCYIIRIDRGEKIIEALKDFVSKQGIKAGYLSGIGAVSHCTTKYYSYDKKEYSEQNFNEEMEITSMVGNIAWHQGSPIIHAHVNLADKDMHVRGGHLSEATVAATCEIVIHASKEPLFRVLDEDTKLYLLDI